MILLQRDGIREFIGFIAHGRFCDIGRSTYAKYEAGELNIRTSVLIELKKIDGYTYDDFFEGLDIREDDKMNRL